MEIEEKRGFFGVIVPVEILDAKELSISEKFIYAFVASFTKACFLSNEKIAERIGVSKETVSRALTKLSKLGYVYVELVNGNSAARRIYAVFENPKKLAYLAKKGLFNREQQPSFPQARQNDEPRAKNEGEARQNDEGVSQNDEPHNRGEVSQNDYHRIKEEKEEESAAGCSGSRPASRPLRKDYQTQEEWEQAIYNFRG